MSKKEQMLAALVVAVERAPRLTRRAYFERTHANREPLKPLGKPCHDCAITCGFYTPYADDLANEDAEFQRRIADRWFCHNHPNRACAGVRSHLGIVEEEA